MNKKGNNGLKRWAVLSAIAIEMGVIIYGFVQLGKWLDHTYNDNNRLYVMLFTLLGVGISLFLVVKQTNKLNK